jgi:hypothetical protein
MPSILNMSSCELYVYVGSWKISDCLYITIRNGIGVRCLYVCMCFLMICQTHEIRPLCIAWNLKSLSVALSHFKSRSPMSYATVLSLLNSTIALEPSSGISRLVTVTAIAFCIFFIVFKHRIIVGSSNFSGLAQRVNEKSSRFRITTLQF